MIYLYVPGAGADHRMAWAPRRHPVRQRPGEHQRVDPGVVEPKRDPAGLHPAQQAAAECLRGAFQPHRPLRMAIAVPLGGPR